MTIHINILSNNNNNNPIWNSFTYEIYYLVQKYFIIYLFHNTIPMYSKIDQKILMGFEMLGIHRIFIFKIGV